MVMIIFGYCYPIQRMCEPICIVKWYFIRVFKIYKEYFFKLYSYQINAKFFLNSRWVNAIHDRKNCEYCQCVIIKSHHKAPVLRRKKKTVSIPNKNKTTEITQMVHVFKKKMIHTLWFDLSLCKIICKRIGLMHVLDCAQ